MSIINNIYLKAPEPMGYSVEATLRVLRVPEAKIRETVELVLSMDISRQVREAIDKLLADMEATADEAE